MKRWIILLLCLMLCPAAAAESYIGTLPSTSEDICGIYGETILFRPSGEILLTGNIERITEGVSWFRLESEEPNPSYVIGTGELNFDDRLCWHLVDGDGNIVSDRSFDSLSAAHADRICFGEGPNEARLYGLIDEHGETVVPAKYANLQSFGDNHYYSVNEDETIIIVDRDGAETFTGMHMPEALTTWSFYPDARNNLLPAWDPETELMGYLAPDGTWAIEPAFRQAGFFEENGLARIRSHSRYDDIGLIDESGTIIVPAQYDTCQIRGAIIARHRNKDLFDVYSPDGTLLFSHEGLLKFWGPGFYCISHRQMLDNLGNPIVSTAGLSQSYTIFTGSNKPEGQLMYMTHAETGKDFLLSRNYELLSPGYAQILYGCATNDGEVYIVGDGDVEIVSIENISGCEDESYSKSVEPPLYGLVDWSGSEIVPCTFLAIEALDDGPFFCFVTESSGGIMDPQGNVILSRALNE